MASDQQQLMNATPVVSYHFFSPISNTCLIWLYLSIDLTEYGLTNYDNHFTGTQLVISISTFEYR